MSEGLKPGRYYHMRIDIKGLLMKPDRMLRGWTENGRNLPPKEVRYRLMKELEKGHAYMPLGKCDNFDHKEEGCLGHEKIQEPA